MRTIYILIVCMVAFSNSLAFAEAPPSYYTDLQNASPELVTIEVMDVKTQILENSSTMKRAHVLAKAKVHKVERTNSKIKPGDLISLDYEYAYCMCPGQAPTRIVEKGKRYSAYLSSKTTKIYVPAARGASFVPLVKEPRRSNLDKIFQDDSSESLKR